MEGNDGQEGPSSERQRRAAPPATGAPAPAAAAAAALVFPRGAIKRIRVHNFMTYSNTVEIKPGPRLNLVLGPNGTGKSSLVCAICIGLGGRPQLLGRADNLRDFIRRGCDDAWTEITLSGGPGCTDWLVRRDIRIVSGHGYSSKWRLNQREVNQSEVQGLVSELNIQFENLCQFLPQDRVVEFARMDPLQLLEATQKAIGDSTLSDKHKQVIAKSKEAKTLTVSLAALKARLTKLEDENRALERDAERFKRRQQLKRDLADIGTKEVWLEVGSKEADLERDELALCSSKEMLQRFKDEAADDAAPLKQARQRHKSAKDELQRLGAPPNSQTLAARRRKLMEDIEKHSNEHVTLQDRIGNLQQRSDQLRAETAEAQRVLTAAQRAFSELPPTVINMDFNQRTLEDRQTALRGQRVKIMQAMAALDSTRTRRLQAMDRNKPGLAGLHHWLEDVKRRGGVLQGPAFGPLGLEVTLRDALSHAKVIDAACGDMLLAFAVTCRADEEVMSAEIKRRGMDGVTVHVMDQPLDTPYKHFGVQSTLADLVDAPPLVMQALTSAGPALACSLFVPNESKIDELMRQPRVQTVFSLSAQFRVIKGSYGGSNARQAQDLGQPKPRSGSKQR
ncbi:MAG: P-loop containing nucleoside triphosphate hydrolase protein [Monoraphidium minutum]|nr:MAG: P-loop containing nucleoside triphosphate hydrolase protein [Monoraphidium minutum]